MCLRRKELYFYPPRGTMTYCICIATSLRWEYNTFPDNFVFTCLAWLSCFFYFISKACCVMDLVMLWMTRAFQVVASGNQAGPVLSTLCASLAPQSATHLAPIVYHLQPRGHRYAPILLTCSLVRSLLLSWA